MRLRLLAGQGARYLVTGGLAAGGVIGGFWLLTHAGLAILPAAIASFCVAAIVNFTATSAFVFKQRPSARRFATFLVFACVGLAINASATWALAHALPWPVLAKIGGVACAFVANFLMNALIVFREET
jgi:putative flippase GtrA